MYSKILLYLKNGEVGRKKSSEKPTVFKEW